MQNVLHDQLAIQLWIESRTGLVVSRVLTMHARLVGCDPTPRVAASWPWPASDDHCDRPPCNWAAGEIVSLAMHALADDSDLPFDRPRLLGQVAQALATELLSPGRPRVTLENYSSGRDPGLVSDMHDLAAAGVPCRLTEDADGPVVEILGHGWPLAVLVTVTGSRGWCDWERWTETRDRFGVPLTRLSGLRPTTDASDDDPDFLRDDDEARASFLTALEFGGVIEVVRARC